MSYIKFKPKDIHEVCLNCRKDCKRPATYWDGQLPPWEYCEEYEERGDLIGSKVK